MGKLLLRVIGLFQLPNTATFVRIVLCTGLRMTDLSWPSTVVWQPAILDDEPWPPSLALIDISQLPWLLLYDRMLLLFVVTLGNITQTLPHTTPNTLAFLSQVSVYSTTFPPVFPSVLSTKGLQYVLPPATPRPELIHKLPSSSNYEFQFQTAHTGWCLNLLHCLARFS